MQRARKVERFLSQPFHVAEQFTGTPGEYVPIAETVRSFKEVLEGQHDELPESAFFLKGSIDQVVEAANKVRAVAKTKFRAEVLTPEGEVFNDEVEMVSTRTEVGSLGILANHTPLLGLLEPTELRLYRSETTSCGWRRARATCRSPTTRCSSSSRRPPSPATSTWPTCATSCARPRRPPSECEPNTEAHRTALRDKRRWETFLRIAGEDA